MEPRPLDVDLPSGATAHFRDPKTLTRRQRDVAQKEMLAQGEATPTPSQAFEVTDTLVSVLVESWSYEYPVSREAIADMPALDSDTLMIEVSQRIPEYWLQIGPTPDPKAPTAPSRASNGSSVAGAATSAFPSLPSSPLTSSSS